jgi:TolB-like protein
VPFLVEELLEGESLKERLERGPLDQAEALRIAAEIGKGLAAAHAKGIVHRDLKPGNVFLTRDGAVKILDFGLARLVVMAGAPETLAEAATAAESTQLGAVLGTVAYMAPEQARGQPVDQRADVFAFGVVLHEMLSGTRPFQGSTATDTLAAILKDEPPPLPASVPPAVAAVVTRCLAKDPDKRYQRGSELRAALEVVPSGGVVPAPCWPSRPSRRLWLVAVALLVGVAVTALLLDVDGLRTRVLGGRRGPARSVKLAVLPFANLSGNPEQEYLSDGLTQEMIAQLGRLHPGSLSVIARTSVMRYKKSEASIAQIGRELGVDYVLEGSAQREAGRIRISAELIQVRDQTQLWADVYEREISGILALQGDVAQKVAAALALKLLPAEQARLASARAVNPEAYEAYLKGSQYWIKMTPGDLDTAEGYFNVALHKDPDFAAAYTGMAWVWACRNQMGYAPPGEAVPRMREAALKAISLDDTLAESHYALAALKTWHDWDLPGAAREWERAVELDPNFADGVAMYSHFLTIMGRTDEAMAQVDRALSLDPFNVTIHSFRAVDLYCARRYDEAILQARKALDMQPNAPVALGAFVLASHEEKQYDQVIAAASTFYARWAPDVKEALERGDAELGYAGAYRRATDIEASSHGEEPGAAFDISQNYLIAGETARALDWLEKAYQARDPNMPYIGCMPIFDPLRSEPRFQSLLRRMNLPVE